MTQNNGGPRGRTFTSFDGEDANGVRAEVAVETGTGPISEIVDVPSRKNAQIKFAPPHLKFPVQAWISKDDPVYKLILDAYDKGEEVEYRIESQRKSKSEDGNPISRSTPIAELRPNSDEGRKNTTRILAGINGELTQERVTDPSEDQIATGGRIPANSKPAAAPAPESQAGGKSYPPSQGNNNGQNRPGQREPAAYFEFFPDGSYNYGSFAAKSAFYCESFVYDQLESQGVEYPEPGMVAFYMGKILTMTGALQSYYLYNKAPADNMAGSFTEVRRLIESIIKRKMPFPTDASQADEWAKRLGKEATLRLKTVIAGISGAPAPSRSEQPAVRPAQAPQERQHTESAPASERPAQERQAPVERDSRPVADSARPKYDESGTFQESALNSMTSDAPAESASETSIPIFEPVDLMPLRDEERADETEVEAVREFCTENHVSGPDMFALLSHSFRGVQGVNQGDVAGLIRKLPAGTIFDFLGFYEQVEPNDLLNAVRFAQAKVMHG